MKPALPRLNKESTPTGRALRDHAMESAEQPGASTRVQDKLTKLGLKSARSRDPGYLILDVG
ncbi:MAG: hypothetical protein V1689_12335 [Pseudomonadota bacterium]